MARRGASAALRAHLEAETWRYDALIFLKFDASSDGRVYSGANSSKGVLREGWVRSFPTPTHPRPIPDLDDPPRAPASTLVSRRSPRNRRLLPDAPCLTPPPRPDIPRPACSSSRSSSRPLSPRKVSTPALPPSTPPLRTRACATRSTRLDSRRSRAPARASPPQPALPFSVDSPDPPVASRPSATLARAA